MRRWASAFLIIVLASLWEQALSQLLNSPLAGGVVDTWLVTGSVIAAGVTLFWGKRGLAVTTLLLAFALLLASGIGLLPNMSVVVTNSDLDKGWAGRAMLFVALVLVVCAVAALLVRPKDRARSRLEVALLLATAITTAGWLLLGRIGGEVPDRLFGLALPLTLTETVFVTFADFALAALLVKGVARVSARVEAASVASSSDGERAFKPRRLRGVHVYVALVLLIVISLGSWGYWKLRAWGDEMVALSCELTRAGTVYQAYDYFEQHGTMPKTYWDLYPDHSRGPDQITFVVRPAQGDTPPEVLDVVCSAHGSLKGKYDDRILEYQWRGQNLVRHLDGTWTMYEYSLSDTETALLASSHLSAAAGTKHNRQHLDLKQEWMIPYVESSRAMGLNLAKYDGLDVTRVTVPLKEFNPKGRGRGYVLLFKRGASDRPDIPADGVIVGAGMYYEDAPSKVFPLGAR